MATVGVAGIVAIDHLAAPPAATVGRLNSRHHVEVGAREGRQRPVTDAPGQRYGGTRVAGRLRRS